MRLRLQIAMGSLFLLVAAGSLAVRYYLERSSGEFQRVYTLHRVESLRRDLVGRILKVQGDLFTTHSSLEPQFDEILADVQAVREAADGCATCHHDESTLARFAEMRGLVDEYEQMFSFFVTAEGSAERMEELKSQAAVKADQLLQYATRVSDDATRKLEGTLLSSRASVARAERTLNITLGVVVMAGLFLLIWLSRFVARPVRSLVGATRRIRAGELGHRVDFDDRTEFGELARSFNLMSSSLRESHERQKEVEEELRASNERFELAARGTRDGLWDWDIQTDGAEFSPRGKLMLGFTDSEGPSSVEDWLARVHPEDAAELRQLLARHLEGGGAHFRAEYRVRHREGHYLWILTRGATVRAADNSALRMVGSHTDITAEKTAESQLRHNALHDSLTGLPNRTLFLDRLHNAVARSRRRESGLFAVLYVDLNRFKIVNDTLGHAVGDRVIIDIARRLADLLRPCDTVARFGGDEFVILLDELEKERDAMEVARRIERIVSAPCVIGGRTVVTTASVGIATSSIDFEQPEDLLRYADVAMYRGKGKGPGHILLFDRRLHQKTMELMDLERELRSGFDRDELLCHYQPIVSLPSGRIAGFEALLRWDHPRRGLLYPTDFLPLAEDTGLIVPLGRWLCGEVFRRALAWNEKFPSSPPLFISANLSGRQLLDEGFVEAIRRLLAATGVDTGTVQFELTETALVEHAEEATAKLRALDDMGFHLSLDDFGTGYSSLSYLLRLPIRNLKIDRTFLVQEADGETASTIFEAIVALGRRLGKTITAEGVESIAHLERVLALRCEQAQGYLISRPVRPDDAERLISTGVRFDQLTDRGVQPSDRALKVVKPQ